MAAVYLRGEHKSSNGTEWKVDLYDESYSGSVVTVTTQDLTIAYDAIGDNILEPLKASRAKWDFHNNSSSVDTFLTAFAGGTERRFKMLVYKDSTLYWVGCCLIDQSEWENISKPRVITIHAIDGIGRLEDIEFEKVTDGSYSSQQTLYKFITDALSYNDLAQFWSASDYYIRESCTFYDTQMTTTGTTYSPFILTRCDKNLFLKDQNKEDEDSSVEDEGISCADVLRKILQLYCCRIIHTNGCYYIQQIRNFETSGYNERAIDKNGTVRLVTTSRAHRQSENSVVNMLGNGRWKYYPPLQKVRIENHQQPTTAIVNSGYQFVTDDNNNGDGSPLSTTIQLGSLRGGSGSGKAIRIVLKCVQLVDYINDKRLEVSVKVTAGSYRLKSTATKPDVITWTTTSTDTVDRIITAEDLWVGTYIMEITSPEFPSTLETSCSVTIEWEIAKRDGGSLTGTHDARIQVLPYEIKVLNDGEEPTSTIYEVVNNVEVNSFVIDYGKLTFHDTGELTTKNALEVYDGTNWQQSGVISAGYSSNVELSKTLCLETMALQKSPVLAYIGPLVVDAGLTKGQVDPSKTWYYDAQTFFFNGGELRTNVDEMHGEWVRCLVSKTGVTINNEIQKDITVTNKFRSGVRNTKDYVKDYISRSTLAVLMGDASGATTSLTTTAVLNDHIKDGDTIYILHPVTYRTVDTFTVNGDVSASATSITVDSKTPSETLYIGYLITHGEYDVFSSNYVRGTNMRVTDTDTNNLTQNGEFMTDGANRLYFRSGGTNYYLEGVADV